MTELNATELDSTKLSKLLDFQTLREQHSLSLYEPAMEALFNETSYINVVAQSTLSHVVPALDCRR